LDLSEIPLIDGHCHPPDLSGGAGPADGLRLILSESRSQKQLHEHLPTAPASQASLNRLAALYECRRSIEGVAAAIEEREIEERCRHLSKDSGVSAYIFDHRFPPNSPDLNELSRIFGKPAFGALRIESVAEDLLAKDLSFSDFLKSFRDIVGAYKKEGGVALKSIIAYRSGLDVWQIPIQKASKAYDKVRKSTNSQDRTRIESKPLLDFLFWEALYATNELRLPFQLHTGFGDSDIHLPNANPILLRPVFEESSLENLPIILLHAGYPFVRETGYLTSIYPNTYVDISLVTPLLAGSLPRLLEELFALTPFSKVLFGSDGHSLPEMHWLGAYWVRSGFERWLEDRLRDGITENQARDGVERVFWKNASELYGLPALDSE
jgi:predicted TIM-barrel fold metal-dependent hydrolase